MWSLLNIQADAAIENSGKRAVPGTHLGDGSVQKRAKVRILEKTRRGGERAGRKGSQRKGRALGYHAIQGSGEKKLSSTLRTRAEPLGKGTMKRLLWGAARRRG